MASASLLFRKHVKNEVVLPKTITPTSDVSVAGINGRRECFPDDRPCVVDETAQHLLVGFHRQRDIFMGRLDGKCQDESREYT